MAKIEKGDKLPEFSLPDQNGLMRDMKDFIGKSNIVLFFYPKNDTPGCTREACAFRDHYDDFADAGAEVFGISGQSVKSHKKFAEKHNLNYPILSDQGNKVRKMFGVPSGLFGLVPGRVTYIADQSGKVIYIFDSQTNVEQHVKKALEVLGIKSD
ncbi:MAG: peroxiredoxin [Tangfeifania sp.]